MQNDNPFLDNAFASQYLKMRLMPTSHNELIEKPALYSLLPSLEGLCVVDLGCGHGDFCMYAQNNKAAKVIGVEPSTFMANKAREFDANLDIRQINMCEYKSEKDSIDLVVSSLAIHYVEDLKKLFSNIHHYLKNGCKFIFSIEHPINTASPNSWGVNDKGNKVSFNIENYNHEERKDYEWFGTLCHKYHRKIETYLMSLINLGFSIESILEPQATEHILNINADLEYENIRPPYLIVSAVCHK